MRRFLRFASTAAALIAVSHGGTAQATISWTTQTVEPGTALTSVSCPSVSFCAAIDGRGKVLTAPGPSGPWTATSVGTALQSVACPSPSLCVAAGANEVWVSTDPTTGASSWSPVLSFLASAENGLPIGAGVSCPTTGFCAVVESGVFCGIASFICTPEARAYVATSSDPGGGAGAWSSARLDQVSSADGIACASNALCVIADGGAAVETSTDPTGTAQAWSRSATGVSNAIDVRSGSRSGIACLTPAACLVVTGDQVAVGTRLGGGSAQWRATSVGDPTAAFTAIACPVSTMCVAVDGSGRAWSSANPTGPVTDWSASRIEGRIVLNPSSCPGEPRCVAVVNAISCPTSTTCVAVDSDGNAIVGTPTPLPPGVGARELTARIRGLLRAALRRPHPSTSDVLHRHGARVRVTSPFTGAFAFSWWHTVRSHRHRHRILVAAGRRSFSGSVTAFVQLTLTRAGARLLHGRPSLRVAATGRFTAGAHEPIPAGGSATFTDHLTLRRTR